MSLKPIETVVYCDKCGNRWIEERNTLDSKMTSCNKCGNKVTVY